MGFLLEYSDVPNLNLYSFIYTSGNLSYKPSTDSIATFTDATATGFALDFIEDVNRQGYYHNNNTGSYFINSNVFNIEIWERVGALASKSADVLKASTQIIWNGLNSVEALGSPVIKMLPSLGTYQLDDVVYHNAAISNIYGKTTTADVLPGYNIYGPSNSIVGTGVYSVVGGSDPTLYVSNFTLTSGTYGFGNFRIVANASVNNYKVNNFTTFTVQRSINLNDIIGLQAYASGFINDGTPTASSFICDISSNYDDQYNGQIFRLVNGNLVGQGRIVLDYVNGTKRLTLNKALAAAPANGTKFLIYPIGGELGVL